MKIQWKPVLLTILLCFADRLSATICSSPQPTSDVLTNAIVIDARHGSFDGRRKYAVGDQTRVVVINKNPFRYSYVLKIDESRIEEDAIGKFFALADISAEPAPEEEPEAESTDATPAPMAPAMRAACRAVTANLVSRETALKEVVKDLKPLIENEVKESDRILADVKRELLDPSASGDELCKDATEAVNQIGAYSVNPEIAAKLEQLHTLIKQQKAAIRAAAADASDACDEQEIQPRRESLENAEEVADWAEEQLEELAAREEDLKELAKEVKDTAERGNAFWELRALGPHLERTEAKISLTRTDTSVAEATAEVIRPEVLVRFGAGLRFFLAGGIAASSADVRSFKPIDGFVLDRSGNPVLDEDGKPTFGKVVGVEEDSVGRVSPAVLLHGLIWRPERWGIDGIGVALGVGAAGSDETVIQFFVGPTVSMADDHLFVTLGAFRGQETRLAGDFYVGAAVPDEATISTAVRSSWNFGLGLTFRIP